MAVSTAIAIVDAQQLERERAETKVDLDPFVAQAHGWVVECATDAEGATEFLGECARRLKMLEDRRKKLKGPIVAAGKEVDTLFKELSEPLAGARAAVEPKLLAWRKVEQQRIDAENAEIERQRQEQQRLEDERQRKIAEEARAQREAAEAAARQLEAQAEAGDERAEQDARAAREAAEMAAHAEAIAAEVRTVAPIAAPEVQDNSIRVAGATASVRKTWQATVVEPMLVPRQFLIVDQKAINAAVNRSGDPSGLNIPGVKIEQIEKLAMRT